MLYDIRPAKKRGPTNTLKRKRKIEPLPIIAKSLRRFQNISVAVLVLLLIMPLGIYPTQVAKADVAATNNDDFTAVNGTTLNNREATFEGAGQGWNWTISQGTITIQSNQLQFGSTNGTAKAVAGFIPGSADYEISLTVNNFGTRNFTPKLVVRAPSDGSPGGYDFTDTSNGMSRIERINADGTSSVLASISNGQTAGTTYKFRVGGPVLTAYENGVQVLTTTDSTWTAAGRVELQGYDSGGNLSDDFIYEEVEIPNTIPVSRFEVIDRESLQINVNAGLSTDADGDDLTYAWDWGDNSATSTGQTASHIYSSNGSYTVTLTANDGKATSTAQQIVSLGTPADDIFPGANWNGMSGSGFVVTPTENSSQIGSGTDLKAWGGFVGIDEGNTKRESGEVINSDATLRWYAFHTWGIDRTEILMEGNTFTIYEPDSPGLYGGRYSANIDVSQFSHDGQAQFYIRIIPKVGKEYLAGPYTVGVNASNDLSSYAAWDNTPRYVNSNGTLQLASGLSASAPDGAIVIGDISGAKAILYGNHSSGTTSLSVGAAINGGPDFQDGENIRIGLLSDDDVYGTSTLTSSAAISWIGNDSNDGTQAHPWRTAYKAISALKNISGTVYLMNGRYDLYGYPSSQSTAKLSLTLAPASDQNDVVVYMRRMDTENSDFKGRVILFRGQGLTVDFSNEYSIGWSIPGSTMTFAGGATPKMGVSNRVVSTGSGSGGVWTEASKRLAHSDLPANYAPAEGDIVEVGGLGIFYIDPFGAHGNDDGSGKPYVTLKTSPFGSDQTNVSISKKIYGQVEFSPIAISDTTVKDFVTIGVEAVRLRNVVIDGQMENGILGRSNSVIENVEIKNLSNSGHPDGIQWITADNVVVNGLKLVEGISGAQILFSDKGLTHTTIANVLARGGNSTSADMEFGNDGYNTALGSRGLMLINISTQGPVLLKDQVIYHTHGAVPEGAFNDAVLDGVVMKSLSQSFTADHNIIIRNNRMVNVFGGVISHAIDGGNNSGGHAESDLYSNPASGDFSPKASGPLEGGVSYRLIGTDYNNNLRGEPTAIGALRASSETASDTTPPILSEITPITDGSDNTPEYTFSSTESGLITYGGSCSSDTTIAMSGNNTIVFNALADGTYSNCTITVTDDSFNESDPLSVSIFTISTASPTPPPVPIPPTPNSVRSLTPIPTVIPNDETPNTPADQPGSPLPDPFLNYLRYGMTSLEVKKLQEFLNQDPDTSLGKDGPGSKGRETTFFGPRTLSAVKRFQQKYLQDILSPWGLTKGTGFVGKTTLQKINRMIGRG